MKKIEEQVIGFEALEESMNKCIKGVLWKDSVAHFWLNWIDEVSKLERQLEDGTYTERQKKTFTITEPKRREIMSIAFRDRVYQRSLNDNVIYPAMSRPLIPNNFACQKGKGTDAAREAMVQLLRRHYRKYGSDGYILQCDIEGYYPNMSHKMAKDLLRQKLDPVTYKRAETIIDGFPGDYGFNPGSQIIQIIGISALDSLDHYIKERLHVEGYERYMDDFELIEPTKESAEDHLRKISRKLAEKEMKLNKKKTQIRKLTDGFLFLGFVFRLKSSGKVIMTLNPDKVKHERKKLYRMAQMVKRGEKERARVDEHYKSWKVHASKGNSNNMMSNMDTYYNNLWKEEKDAVC
jgi:hypothetical protein